MRAGQSDRVDAEALSMLDWWVTAGLETLVDERPRDWFAKAAPRAPAAPPASAGEAAPPQTLPELAARLADPARLAALGPRRIAPSGDPAAGLMILADMPEPDDRVALFDGALATLFDRILAAIGRDRTSAYVASLCPARPAGGTVPDRLRPELAALARRHVELAAPRRLLLLGQATAAAFDLSVARGPRRLDIVNLDGRELPVVATHHPRLLLRQPACKADVWADLLLLTRGEDQ